MIVLEYEDIELDYCASCHGVWLDGGELELLFGDREITEGFLRAGEPAPRKGETLRRCPICRRKMDKFATGGHEPVTYDHCPHNDGLWFDEGELFSILKHGSDAPGSDKVGAWLRECFPQNPAPSE
jgi:Zn-finger nucleic acid-binding protein